jgi:tRNA (guanine37-N1)-methyltransferase
VAENHEVCVLTLFPELFDPFWDHGIIRRAVQGKKSPMTINIRDHAQGRHRVTDDRPYGGGCGMVMKPEPLTAALAEAKKRCHRQRPCCSPRRESGSISPWPIAGIRG